MFKLKKPSAGSNPINIDPNTALPNSYGHIRTLKEDFENFKTGKKESAEEVMTASAIPSQPRQAAPAKKPEVPPEPARIQSELSQVPVEPPQEKSSTSQMKSESDKRIVPNPLGSENFFQTQSPFDEKAKTPGAEAKTTAPKSKSSLIAILSIILLFAIAGGGVYYWWFFIKSPKKEVSQTVPKTNTAEQPPNTAQGESQTLKQWNLDPEVDKIANKLAVERYAKSLNASSDSEKAIEIKILSKNNQPVSPQKFEEIFDFQLPVSISGKLTEDYSLFLVKENDEPRLGAAFKLNQALGLAESLKSEEATTFANLKSFYLDKAPTDASMTFNSSKYKDTDIRYFNFPSPPNTSLDYTVLSDKQNSYFLFSTSKNSIRAILDYMSEK